MRSWNRLPVLLNSSETLSISTAPPEGFSRQKRGFSAVPLLLLSLITPPASAERSVFEDARVVVTRQLAPGIQYRHLQAPPDEAYARFRVVSEVFASRQQAATAILQLSYPPVPLSIEPAGAGFRAASGALPTEEMAQLALAHLRYLGLPGVSLIYEGIEDLSATGPLCIHVLELAPGAAVLRPARAMDQGLGLETVSSMARRHGALAGTNGGYFRTRGTYRGETEGIYRWSGKWISESRNLRSAVGFYRRDGQQQLVLGNVFLRLTLQPETGASLVIDGVNRPREENELILYTPEFHPNTLTDAGGLEIIVSGGEVAGVLESAGSSPIPAGGWVLSASGRAAVDLRTRLRPGMRVGLQPQITASDPEQQGRWQEATDIVGAGPRLLAAGREVFDREPESANPAFFHRRHPRTAIGIKADGGILLVVVDGRQWRDSLGLSIPQLARLMRQLGCSEALNLDGGGSSALVVGQEVMNHPSDAGGERAVSDGLLVFPPSPPGR